MNESVDQPSNKLENDHLHVHLTCPVGWLTNALRRRQYVSADRHGLVTTDAPQDVVELLLSYRRPPLPSGWFACCAPVDGDETRVVPARDLSRLVRELSTRVMDEPQKLGANHA